MEAQTGRRSQRASLRQSRPQIACGAGERLHDVFLRGLILGLQGRDVEVRVAQISRDPDLIDRNHGHPRVPHFALQNRRQLALDKVGDALIAPVFLRHRSSRRL